MGVRSCYVAVIILKIPMFLWLSPDSGLSSLNNKSDKHCYDKSIDYAEGTRCDRGVL